MVGQVSDRSTKISDLNPISPSSGWCKCVWAHNSLPSSFAPPGSFTVSTTSRTQPPFLNEQVWYYKLPSFLIFFFCQTTRTKTPCQSNPLLPGAIPRSVIGKQPPAVHKIQLRHTFPPQGIPTHTPPSRRVPGSGSFPHFLFFGGGGRMWNQQPPH